MSKNPNFENEMIKWEEEKYKELLEEIKPQMNMIKSMTKQIAVVLQKYRENWDLEFGSDVQSEIENLVFENL